MKISKRKAFSQEILFSDDFTALPLKVRWLYLSLNFSADDDGFIGSPNYIVNACTCTRKDFSILVDRGYIIRFPSGVALVTHWYVHNKPFRADRYHPTEYVRERALVTLGPDKVYYLKEEANVIRRTS